MIKSLCKLGLLLILAYGTMELNTSYKVTPSGSAAVCVPVECKNKCIGRGFAGGACFEGQCFCFLE
jgi:hypothetical protein